MSSSKNDTLHKFESSLERDFISVLEFDYLVDRYVEQPIEIEYLDDGKLRLYTPDFLVFYRTDREVCKNATPLLCEIKYSEDIKKNGQEYTLKFQAASVYCKKHGYRFEVLTEREIRNDFLINARFLQRYKRVIESTSMNDYYLIDKTLSELVITTPSELLLACARDWQRRAEILYTLWNMIANCEVGCDLNRKLTMNSEIWKTAK